MVEPPLKVPTPYGGRLVFSLPGDNNLVVHLKDKLKIRNKKRWSMVSSLIHVNIPGSMAFKTQQNVISRFILQLYYLPLNNQIRQKTPNDAYNYKTLLRDFCKWLTCQHRTLVECFTRCVRFSCYVVHLWGYRCTLKPKHSHPTSIQDVEADKQHVMYRPTFLYAYAKSLQYLKTTKANICTARKANFVIS